MALYNPLPIEEKWLSDWEQQHLFQNTASTFRPGKKKDSSFFALFAFAYPSGSGLHVGHVESKTALDILVRFLRMQGNDVFFPVGWDAFGLPAENYAIKTGIHPSETTLDAINTFRRQIKRLGISYDWGSELATCHPAYYRWTQWIFVELFKHGLAYRDTGWVNWCPQDKTVLANEQVVNGACERCGSAVVQKELEQWKFRITAYRDELLSGLEQVDWPKATKEQQMNWIGKSEGVHATFALELEQSQQTLTCFTTRLDTIYGVSFLVISPEKFKELGLLEQVSTDRRSQVATYLDQSFHKTEEQRRIGEKDKSGVDTGLTVKHPITGESIPLWIADYVLAGYGTGVVMGVPAHDARDHAFAMKFDLPIIEVIQPTSDAKRSEGIFSDFGVLVQSGKHSGLASQEAIKKLIEEYPEDFSKTTSYKLRDWLISRQRYWGAPIPMLYCAQCAKNGKGWWSENAQSQTSVLFQPQENERMPGWYPVEADTLPVELPDVSDFRPTDDGRSPIEKASDSWKYTKCPGCGGQAKREVDTMDTFVDSSWYFLRYATVGHLRAQGKTDTNTVPFDQALTQAILPVDLYLIGPEHIVLHLLYSRFFTKFFRDIGLISFDEPFLRMRHQGMILGPDGKKMSKSKGNVITPDSIIEKYGADTLRVYEMFMGPLDADKAWDMSSVAGVYRFLSKVYTLFVQNAEHLADGETKEGNENTSLLQRKLHWAINKLTLDIPQLKFNTSIAALMEFVNVWSTAQEAKNYLSKEELTIVARLLAPLAPFLAEELWSMVSSSETSVHTVSWPVADPALLASDTLEIVIQLNGKVKTKLTLEKAIAEDQERLETAVRSDASVENLLADLSIKKTIAVPGRLVNFVV